MKKRKYPELNGCFEVPAFNKLLKRRFMEGEIRVYNYKGSIMLSVLSNRACVCQPPMEVWLSGDRLEELIDILSDAKRAWVAGYLKAAKVLKRARRDRPKRKKRFDRYGSGRIVRKKRRK